MKVHLSIDDIGLEKKPQDKYEIVGTRKRTAYGWQEIEVDQAAELIGNRGHAAIPGHMVGGTKAVNCKAMQVFMLDFDEGISFKVEQYFHTAKKASEIKLVGFDEKLKRREEVVILRLGVKRCTEPLKSLF